MGSEPRRQGYRRSVFRAEGKRYGGGNGYYPRKEILVDAEEMKRQYRAKQKQIRTLEAERAAILGRGDQLPSRLRFRLEMTRIEAEELRTWGHRKLVRAIREGG
jgi:hypothetical protein